MGSLRRRSRFGLPRLLLAALLGALTVPVLTAPAHAAGTLTVVVVGPGRVTGGGIDCTAQGGVCSVENASLVTLNATAHEGYSLTWTGCLASPLGDSCTATVLAPTTVTATYRDVQPPSEPVLTPGSGSTVAGTIDIVADVTDNSGSVHKVVFKVDGVQIGNADIQAPFVVEDFYTPSLTNGEHTFTAEAYDAADLRSPVGRSTLTVDNTPPETEIVKAPPERVVTRRKRATVTFVFASSEENSTFECNLDGFYENCSRRQDWRLPVGRHVLRVAAIDAAGTPDPSPAVYRWRIVQLRR